MPDQIHLFVRLAADYRNVGVGGAEVKGRKVGNKNPSQGELF